MSNDIRDRAERAIRNDPAARAAAQEAWASVYAALIERANGAKGRKPLVYEIHHEQETARAVFLQAMGEGKGLQEAAAMARASIGLPVPVPSTFAEAEAMRDLLDGEAANASAAWRAIKGVGSGAMGLTPDEVKFSPEYRKASARYERAADALKAYNRAFLKRYTKELAADRVARRAQLGRA